MERNCENIPNPRCGDAGATRNRRSEAWNGGHIGHAGWMRGTDAVPHIGHVASAHFATPARSRRTVVRDGLP